MRIDLDSDNVYVLEMTREEVRAYVEGAYDMTDLKDFDLYMDEAQGEIGTGRQKECFVVLHIKE